MSIELIVIGILVLGVLIFVHELGHFLLAKWNGVGVVEFSIGFGPKILQKRIGETKYAIGIIPLGGYVRMVGDDPRLLAPDNKEQLEEAELEEEEVSEEEKELLADKSRWFLTQSYLPKVSIVFAGPLFNILFAILLSIGAYLIYGKQVPIEDPIIGGVYPKRAAEKAGLKAGDHVTAIDGREIKLWEELAKRVSAARGETLTFSILRKEEGQEEFTKLDIQVTPEPIDKEMAILNDEEDLDRHMIGVAASSKPEPVSGVIEATTLGSIHIWILTKTIMKGMGAMITGAISRTNIAGPIFIFGEAARSAEKGFEQLIGFMVFLSISLAILNLLPIPILDGGHLLFFTIEAIKGGPLSLKAQSYANQVGLFILLSLMIFAIGNDIVRLITGSS